MHNLICMTGGFSLPFFPSWKSQVASIIYTSLRLFLSLPRSSLPVFLSSPSPLLSPGNLAFAALLISILQNVQMPPKSIHLPALWCCFTCTQTTPSTFCTTIPNKGDKIRSPFLLMCLRNNMESFGLLSVVSLQPHSTQLHHPSWWSKVFDTAMMTAMGLNRHLEFMESKG